MDARTVNNISEKLFDCFNYMRSTVEGILACNNPSVWNVFGGLSRTKQAVFNILVNELRTQNSYKQRQVEQDSLKVFLYFFFGWSIWAERIIYVQMFLATA